ncbi:hypothetical protein ZWY2020_033237 [Hordeum vulgare]|nr:hypothetical protein ZWY2020_033237 [Hordeum vulgare]
MDHRFVGIAACCGSCSLPNTTSATHVTKKKDLSDFYFGLVKNVALGARTHDSTEIAEPEKLEDKGEDVQPSKSDAEGSGHSPKRGRESSVGSDKAHESRSVVEPATTESKDSIAARSIEKEADVSTSASQALQNAQPAPITVSTIRGVMMHLLLLENEHWLVRERRSSKYEVRCRYNRNMPKLRAV